MNEVATGAPQAGAPESVMVLSCWPHGVAGGMLVRATLSSSAREPRVVHTVDRSRVHELLDEWLDDSLDPGAVKQGREPDRDAPGEPGTD
ncbi:hypothetical protein GCM10022399_03770 [Terrabacter ginsenosidimutans]|jgi:hypothetical protein|uniref:Uncharacterized protein n=1 Tax=Terrabacter ginsenosidimutans TaxID=490575 RepID=A0ABP7CIE9_9MICO